MLLAIRNALGYPTQKPLDLIEAHHHLLHPMRGEVVLDPFAGCAPQPAMAAESGWADGGWA